MSRSLTRRDVAPHHAPPRAQRESSGTGQVATAPGTPAPLHPTRDRHRAQAKTYSTSAAANPRVAISAAPRIIRRSISRRSRSGDAGSEVEALQAATCQRRRLVLSGTMCGVVRRLQEVLDRASRISRLFEVHRQLRGDLTDAISVDRFSALADPPMDLGTAHRRQQPVRHFEIEHVTELVSRGDRAVWQFDDPRRRQKLMPSDQRFTLVFDPLSFLSRPAAMATDEHCMPTTLAPSSTSRSSALRRSICFSISCRMFSGTPAPSFDGSSPTASDRSTPDHMFLDQVLTTFTMNSGLPSVRL